MNRNNLVVHIDGHRKFYLDDILVQPGLNQIGSTRVAGKAMDVLVALADAAPDSATNDDLLARVWRDVVVVDGVLHKAVAHLRKALKDDARHPRHVETIPGRGYRIMSTVDCDASGASGARGQAGCGAGHGARTLNGQQGRGSASIAVLPFDNRTGAPTCLCDALAEEILNRVIPLSGVRVISRNASFACRDSALDIRELGRLLSADYILQGTVWRDDNLVRISIRLTDTSDGIEIWANSYDRLLTNTLQTQSDVACCAVAEIAPKITFHASADRRIDPHARIVQFMGVLKEQTTNGGNASLGQIKAGFWLSNRLRDGYQPTVAEVASATGFPRSTLRRSLLTGSSLSWAKLVDDTGQVARIHWRDAAASLASQKYLREHAGVAWEQVLEVLDIFIERYGRQAKIGCIMAASRYQRLRQFDPIPVRENAEFCGVTANAFRRFMDKLAAAGLVRYEKHTEDGRRLVAVPTVDLQLFYHQLAPYWQE